MEENKEMVAEEVVNEKVDTQDTTEQQEEMIPKAQVEKIIKERLDRAEKAKQKAVEEAEKLAKMNKDEKEKYRVKQLEEELAELKRKDAYYGLSKEAAKMLAEQGVQADDDLLAIVVKDDAEATKQAVGALVAVIDAKVDEKVKKALSGTAPKVHIGGTKALTKEDILAEKDSAKRIRLIQENDHLFN